MKLLNKSEQVYKELKKELINGTWKLGDKIPSENELIELYNVGRSTIREALNMLSVEGIIEKKHGLGSFINRIPTNIGTIAVFVRLEFISENQYSFWYRNLIHKIDEFAHNLGYDVTIVTGYGNTMSLINKSITKSFNRIQKDGIIAIINLLGVKIDDFGFPMVDFGVECNHSKNGVNLSYKGFFEGAKRLFLEKGYDDFCVLYQYEENDEKNTASAYYILKQYIDDIIDNDDTRRLSFISADEIPAVFRRWYKSNKGKKALLIVDDNFCDYVSYSIGTGNIRVPEDIAIITHANVGKTFMTNMNYDRFGFDANIVVSKIFEVLLLSLNNSNSNKVIRLEAIYQQGNSI